MKNFVAYYRVSTAKQGASGLGLDAQEEAVKRIVEFKGGEIIASFREVESGANNQRTELAAAMKLAKAQKAIVIVAKLDRLARDAKFLLTLADAGTPLLFGDFPDMDCTTPVGRMVLTQMAAVAEFERRRISERVKAALAQAALRGVKLGGYRGGHFPKEVHERGRQIKLEMADKTALELVDIMNEIDPDKKLSRVKLAEQMNVYNVRTPSGKGKWVTTTVTRLLKRVEAIHANKRRTANKSLRSVSDRLQKQPGSVRKRSIGGDAGPVAS